MNETNKIIKVAQIIGPAINGGTESFVMNYYKHIDHSKIEFDFFVESQSKIINTQEVQKYGNGKIFIIPNYSHVFSYIKKLKTIFSFQHYDIVHSNMNTLSFLSLFSAKIAKVPIRIAHSHSTANHEEVFKTFLKSILRKFGFSFSTNLFACSIDSANYQFGEKRTKNKQVTLIKDAIDLERFSFSFSKRKTIREQYGIEEDTFLVGNIGRFQKQKNQIFLIDVFYYFHLSHSNSKLLLVGNGPLLQQLKNRALFYDLIGDVIFAGTFSDVSDFYSAFDCFVFPSLYEGLGITLIEAQASNLPCIISDKIPKETIITKDILIEGLNKSAKEWSTLLFKKEKRNTVDNIICLRKAGYDIKEASLALQKKYTECIDSCEKRK